MQLLWGEFNTVVEVRDRRSVYFAQSFEGEEINLAIESLELIS
jgi:hypothetical protein